MIVYLVVYQEDHEGLSIYGIYSTRELANQYIDIGNNILEWEVDVGEVCEKGTGTIEDQIRLNVPFLQAFSNEKMKERFDSLKNYLDNP